MNLLVLTILLAIWTDPFEVAFNLGIRLFEFLKLIGISFLGLIVIRIAVTVFRKKQLYDIKKRIRISTYLIIGISSYFYVDYSIEIIDHRIIHANIRNSVMSKYNSFDSYPYGGTAANLTIQEYSEILKTTWFPELPKSAENIEYDYTYDGFLPDYSLTLKYDLPKHIHEIRSTTIRKHFIKYVLLS
ncbi:MAG: hypothetical protein AAF617_11710 [Bacteroidota bacterium]